MADTVTLIVSRYRPEEESEPTFQSYEVPFREDWVVLDAINHVKDQLDGSLSYRWSCRMGVCGSCGMMVNGRPTLTCEAPLSDYMPSPIRIEPLQFFPVIRDLVVDITDFMQKLKHAKPWIIRDEEQALADGEYRQTPAEVDVYKQFSHVHQLHVVLRRLSRGGPGTRVHRPRRDRSCPAVQHGLAGSRVA